MFTSIVALVSSLAAVSAGQSSIVNLSGRPIADAPSVIHLACAACDSSQMDESRSTYRVPLLEPGKDNVMISEHDGKPMVTRTGNWMGGSPVRYVSLNPVWIESEQQFMLSRSGRENRSDGVDTKATTSAVSATPVSAPAMPTVEQPALPDFSKFELRPTR
ncbi:plant virulence effector HPE1-like domain-containing protein [Rhizobium helianthi]|uniref:Plant virulence effector HPE1-like domain-containing protein n=1 Tax=Rhizobium helianthi TaxID=1132695 RepID=A0ABW4M7T7_9HYPH